MHRAISIILVIIVQWFSFNGISWSFSALNSPFDRLNINNIPFVGNEFSGDNFHSDIFPLTTGNTGYSEGPEELTPGKQGPIDVITPSHTDHKWDPDIDPFDPKYDPSSAEFNLEALKDVALNSEYIDTRIWALGRMPEEGLNFLRNYAFELDGSLDSDVSNKELVSIISNPYARTSGLSEDIADAVINEYTPSELIRFYTNAPPTLAPEAKEKLIPVFLDYLNNPPEDIQHREEFESDIYANDEEKFETYMKKLGEILADFATDPEVSPEAKEAMVNPLLEYINNFKSNFIWLEDSDLPQGCDGQSVWALESVTFALWSIAETGIAKDRIAGSLSEVLDWVNEQMDRISEWITDGTHADKSFNDQIRQIADIKVSLQHFKEPLVGALYAAGKLSAEEVVAELGLTGNAKTIWDEFGIIVTDNLTAFSESERERLKQAYVDYATFEHPYKNYTERIYACLSVLPEDLLSGVKVIRGVEYAANDFNAGGCYTPGGLVEMSLNREKWKSYEETIPMFVETLFHEIAHSYHHVMDLDDRNKLYEYWLISSDDRASYAPYAIDSRQCFDLYGDSNFWEDFATVFQTYMGYGPVLLDDHYRDCLGGGKNDIFYKKFAFVASFFKIEGENKTKVFYISRYGKIFWAEVPIDENGLPYLTGDIDWHYE